MLRWASSTPVLNSWVQNLDTRAADYNSSWFYSTTPGNLGNASFLPHRLKFNVSE